MTLLILILTLLLLLMAYCLLIRPNLPRRTLGKLAGVHYAHRGLWNERRPENSLAAFCGAVEEGYGIELDVHLTKDGHLVVHHDDSLKRMTGVDVRIADCTLMEVRACHLPNGEEVPTFDEVLEIVAGKAPLIVEVKVERNAEALSRAVCERMRRYKGPWCMESFDPRAVQWFRKNAPDVIRGQLAFDHAGQGENLLLFLRDIGIASMLQNLLSRPDFVAFEACSERIGSVPFKLVKWMRPHLAAWTIRSQSDIDRLKGQYDLFIFEGFRAR